MSSVKPDNEIDVRFNKVKDGVYLLCGEEVFLKEEASKKLIFGILPPENRIIACEKYDAKDDPGQIFNSLDTLTLLTEKRVVLIKNIDLLPETKKVRLISRLKNRPPSISIILHSKKNTSNDKFINEISDLAVTTLYRKPGKGELKDWVRKIIHKDKRSITTGALELFLELKNDKDLTLLLHELDKLVTYIGDKKPIEESDIINLVGKSVKKRAFDLVDAISLKDRDTAFLLAKELSADGKKDMPEAIGLIGWQFRRLWKARRFMAGRVTRQDIIRELKIKYFAVDKFFSQVRRFGIEDLKKGIKLLLEADHNIKRGNGRPEFILEQLIIALCSVNV